MKIQAVAAKDLHSISLLFVDVFSNPPWDEYWEIDWAYERIDWLYNFQGFKGYVAKDGDRIIGAITGYYMPFQGKKGFKIEEFLIRVDYQNRGVGSLLLERLELSLRQDSYDFISLLTAKDSRAESFYTKRNYQREHKIVLLNKEL